jgi:sRNA-binding carbon storage regulator CsrA
MAKIGIDAPDDVLVDRQEVRNRRDEFADVPCVLTNRCACEKSL